MQGWQAFCNGFLIHFTSGRIQAGCAVLGVAGLLWYAWDNRRIRINSDTQLNNQLLPFLCLSVARESGKRIWTIHNAGAGPAINIRHNWLKPDGSETWLPLSVIASGLMHVRPQDPNESIETLLHGDGFRIEYESLTGEKLATVQTHAKDIDGQYSPMVTEFQRPRR